MNLRERNNIISLLTNQEDENVLIALEILKANQEYLSQRVIDTVTELHKEKTMDEDLDSDIAWNIEKIFILYNLPHYKLNCSDAFYIVQWLRNEKLIKKNIDEQICDNVKKYIFPYIDHYYDSRNINFYRSLYFQTSLSKALSYIEKTDEHLLNIAAKVEKIADIINLKFCLIEYYLETENITKSIRFLKSFCQWHENMPEIIIQHWAENKHDVEIEDFESIEDIFMGYDLQTWYWRGFSKIHSIIYEKYNARPEYETLKNLLLLSERKIHRHMD